MAKQLIFSFPEVQTACRLLIEEEGHLIVDNELPRRSSLVAEVFVRMAFDNHLYIDSNVISAEQAGLIAQYSA